MIFRSFVIVLLAAAVLLQSDNKLGFGGQPGGLHPQSCVPSYASRKVTLKLTLRERAETSARSVRR